MRSYRCSNCLDHNDFPVRGNDDDECHISVSHKYNENGTNPASRKYSFTPIYSISPLGCKKYSSPQFSIQNRTDSANGSSALCGISSRDTFLAHDEKERNSSKMNEKIGSSIISGSANRSQETQRKKQNKKKK